MPATHLPTLHGGRLCLDFCNTLDPRTSDQAHETVHDYADLARWSAHAGALDQEAADALEREAVDRPEEAAAQLERALAFRENLYAVLAAQADGSEPDPAALSALGYDLAELRGCARLARTSEGFNWAWGGNPNDLGRPLWEVARSADALLTGPDLERVKRCPGPGTPCNWLFVDESKNRSRVWCSMEGCGNLAKARRHLKRQKSA